MRLEFYTLEIATSGQKLYEFTHKTIDWIKSLKIKNGIIKINILLKTLLFEIEDFFITPKNRPINFLNRNIVWLKQT